MNRLFIAFLLCIAFAANAIQARPEENPKPEGAVCTICQFLVSYIEKYIQNNATEQQIVSKLQGACKLLGSFQPQCEAFIASEAPALIQLLMEKEPADKVCSQIHACKTATKAEQDHVEFPTVQAPEDATCGLCELVISSVEQWLASNQTEQQIQTNLENICNQLPGGISTLCDQYVEQYLPVAIQWVLNNEPPQVFCTNLGLCSSSKKMALPKAVPKTGAVRLQRVGKFVQPVASPKDGSLCGICELAMASIEQWLQQNSTIQQIEQNLENVCALFPGSVSAVCDQFVMTYYPQAVQWLVNNESPQTFCTQIGLCTSEAKPKVKAARIRPIRQ